MVSSQGHQYGHDYLDRLLSGVDEKIFNNVFALGLTEIQELSSLNGTEASKELYKLASGVDRVSLVDVMRSLRERREALLSKKTDSKGRLIELFGRHRELTRIVENKSDLGRHWISLIEQRRDAERVLRDKKEQLAGLEAQARRLTAVQQILPNYTKWRTKQQELKPLAELPSEREVDLDKLKKLSRRMADFERLLNELQAEAEGLKNSADRLPLNQVLWKHAARIEALGEHQHWISSLSRQAERLQAEIERLEEDDSSGSDASNAGGPDTSLVITRTVMKQLGPAAKRLKSATRQVEVAGSEFADAETELSRVREQLDLAMVENNCDSLGESFQHAGQLVGLLRKRQTVDDRLDQLNQQRKAAEAELDDAIQEQVFSTQRLFGVGAFVVVGIALILGGWSGLFLKNMPTNPLLGFLGCGIVMAGLGLKRYWEYEAQDEVDQAKQQFDSVRQEILKIRDEREQMDATLPEGLGQIDGRLHDAHRRLGVLERLLPLEGRVSEADQQHEDARQKVETAKASLEEAQQRWQAMLSEAGLPDSLTPTQVRRLSERSREFAQARNRLLEARQQLDQYEDDLAGLRDRILDLYTDVGLEANEDEDAIDLLRHLEAELRSQQGLMDQRKELARQHRQIRKRRAQIQARQQRLKLFRTQMFSRVGVASDDEFRRLGERIRVAQLADSGS